jgi:hypothetical protein
MRHEVWGGWVEIEGVTLLGHSLIGLLACSNLNLLWFRLFNFGEDQPENFILRLG